MSNKTEKICTGCGRSSFNPIDKQYAACCPDNNYVIMSNNKQSSVNKLCDLFYEQNIDESNIPREHWEWEIKQLMVEFAIYYNETYGGNK